MPEQPTRARVIFSTGSLYLYDVSHVFALAAEAGFDGIEVMCDDRWSTRDPHYLRDLSEQHGLPILAAHTPFSSKIPGWGFTGDDVNRITRTLDLAERIGCEVIVVHMPSRVSSKSIRLGRMELRIPSITSGHAVKSWIEEKLPHVQGKTSVKIALENMPKLELFGVEGDPYWWNEVETWSKAHDHLTLDTTHWATKKVDPLEAYQAAKGRIAHVHLSNFYDNEEHHLPHKGDLKLDVLLQTMAADGFNGTISLEVHPQNLEYKEIKAVRHKLKAAVAFMREHLGQQEKV